jgi:hypothetical protein
MVRKRSGDLAEEYVLDKVVGIRDDAVIGFLGYGRLTEVGQGQRSGLCRQPLG